MGYENVPILLGGIAVVLIVISILVRVGGHEAS